ncbi:sulfur reduction protein DsrJ [Caldichromatium japonicum]|uniref:Sulfur reduction protein DsrJ n=1 Tax=Caldichromatium japonicum TaxID=2699430 RepID=A0A6G7VAD5_9GAMM|nr:sulfur reduction protein DsrJ [Caldichromatium japonicum]QIK37029.1 sulfur reduction protein DsrJ [Caldichromatium japonicum]
MAKATVMAILAAGLVMGAFAYAKAAEIKRYVVDGSQAAGLPSCVEPTERMRRMHMEFIKHQRIATVHQGIRDTKYSLAGCVDCHVSYDAQHSPRPINQPDQFCGACHRYASVKLDCFDCHAAVPKGLDGDQASRADGLTQGGGR